jgi:hypothetical protein
MEIDDPGALQWIDVEVKALNRDLELSRKTNEPAISLLDAVKAII